VGFDVSDLDFQHGEIRIRTAKNDRPCTTVMATAVAKRLRAFVAGRTEGPLFLAGDHRVSMRHAQRRLTGWFAAAGIQGRSAHSLRHSLDLAIECSGQTLEVPLSSGYEAWQLTTRQTAFRSSRAAEAGWTACRLAP
jgi:integrase